MSKTKSLPFQIQTPPSFNYHLDSAEQTLVESLVPLHQAKIPMAFRASFVVDGQSFKEGAIALSEHQITLSKKKLIGKGFTLLHIFHVLDLSSIQTLSDYAVQLTFDDVVLVFYTEVVLKASRSILRNYILSTFEQPKTLKIKTHDKSDFPAFRPNLSITQIFQFSYYAHCSYFDTSYFHDVVKHFHHMVQTVNGILNINDFPLPLIEPSIGNQMCFDSLFCALSFSNVVFAISARDLNQPGIFESLIPLLLQNKRIRFLSISNCRCVNGMVGLSKAIQENQEMKISYFDLSNNPWEDMMPFCFSLLEYRQSVFYLNLGSTGLSSQATDLLFDAMLRNSSLHELEYLDISGGSINQSGAEKLVRFFEYLNAEKLSTFTHLFLNNCRGTYLPILTCLEKTPNSLQTLSLANLNLKKNANSLTGFIGRSTSLSALNISNTGLTVEQLLDIVDEIDSNNQIQSIDFDIGSYKLNGDKFLKFALHFDECHFEKWTKFGLRNNGMTVENLQSFIVMLKNFPNMQEIDLSENFHETMTNVSMILVDLFDIPSLQKLSVAGNDKFWLGKELLPFVSGLRKAKNLKSLDISNNRGGNEVFMKLTEVMDFTFELRSVLFDGNMPFDVGSFFSVFNVFNNNLNIVHAPFPVNDVFHAVSHSKKSERIQMYSLLDQARTEMQLSIAQHRTEQELPPVPFDFPLDTLEQKLKEEMSDVSEYLMNANTTTHSMVTSVIGLPFPFQNADEKAENHTENVLETSSDNPDAYGTKDADREVNETVDSNIQAFQTLQFNSLLLVRKNVDKPPPPMFHLPDADDLLRDD